MKFYIAAVISILFSVMLANSFPKYKHSYAYTFFLCDNFFRLTEIPQSCALTSTLCLKHQSIEVNVLSSCYFRNVWLV